MTTTVRTSTTVRLNRDTHERLKAIAQRTGEQLSAVMDRAIQQEERRLFWQRFHEDVARLRADPDAWAVYKADAKELEGTLMDGIDSDEDWSFLAQAKPEEVEFLPPENDHAETR